MALRRPLVQVAGQVQQLQAGDTLDAPQASGDVVVLTNDNAGVLVIGTPVYASANDHVDKARANASGTKNMIGLVAISPSIGIAGSGPVMSSGILTATTEEWDAAAGTTGGLAKDTKYFLSAAAAGVLTATAPTAAGQYVVEVGIAISTTELLIGIKRDILL